MNDAKDRSPNSDKSVFREERNPNIPEGQVVTPMGLRAVSNVHLAEAGSRISCSGGRLRQLNRSKEVVADYGEIDQVVARSLMSKSGLEHPSRITREAGLASGWIADGWWQNNTGSPVTYFQAYWNVPAPPVTQSGQLIYLFNVMENAAQSNILQPVLQWGNNGKFGGNYWGTAIWYVVGSQAVTSKYYPISPGGSLGGAIRSADNEPIGPTFSYLAEFPGLPGEGYQVTDIDELVNCYVTLEAYNLTQCSDYPGVAMTAFQYIEIMTGTPVGSNPPPLVPNVVWSRENRQTDCGQQAVVVSNANPNGEVDIYY